jgi:hypothetical protein
MIVTRRERNPRGRSLNEGRCYHGGRRRVDLLRSFLKQKRRAVGEVISTSSGWAIYERTSTGTLTPSRKRAHTKLAKREKTTSIRNK